MKKFLAMCLAISCLNLIGFVQTAYGDDFANVRIKISGAAKDNRYFLCLPNIGCLSILAATTKGKIYPVTHSFEMDNIFVTNMDDFRVHPQGLPTSCNVTVKTNQTITIYGKITQGQNDSILINQLHCSVS